MSESTPPESKLALQPAPFVKASTQLGHFLGMETGALIDTLKSQFFKNLRPEQVTDAQLATVIAVANALKLNPLLPGQLYPYPERSGGVTVMIGPDGIYTLLSNNTDIVATKDGGSAWWTEHGQDAGGKETCTAYINHRTKGLLKKTIWVDEWVVASNPNWNSRRHHMAEIRALKQCARQVVHGIPPDSDEKTIGDMVNVTDTAQIDPPKRDAAPPKATTGAAAAVEGGAGEEKKTRGRKAPVGKVLEGDFQMGGAKPAPVTTLADKESRTFICKIVEFTTAMIESGGQSHASVRVRLDGEFEGSAIHLGGATQEKIEGTEAAHLVANSAYQIDKPVAITLVGRKRLPAIDPVTKAETPRPSAILVENLKLIEEVVTPAAETPAPATPTSEVD